MEGLEDFLRFDIDLERVAGLGGVFARSQDQAAEAAPGPVAADEHRPDPRGLRARVEQARVVRQVGGASVELVTAAPAAARHELAA